MALREESPASRRPSSAEDAADALKDLGAEGRRVRPRGGATKLDWGHPAEDPGTDLSFAGLDTIVEHNEGDLTAVLQAGVPLARAQERFAEAGQMMALDPPLGDEGEATIGGIVAAGDSGPLRHRYGGPRDLVIGITAAMSDGTTAHAGGKVIKNVAGYDLAKLFTGSFGTLGVILELAVRLHPIFPQSVTARGRTEDPDVLADAASSMAHARLEMQSLDVRWDGGRGSVLGRFGGTTAADQAGAALERLEADGLEAEVVEDDDGIWEAQRAGQRSPGGAVVRVSGEQTGLRRVLGAAAEVDASVTGRAALGLYWLALPEDEPDALIGAVEGLRQALAPCPCVLQGAPAAVRVAIDPWGVAEGPELDLMRRVKARFDPQGVCNTGLYAGGI